MEELMVRRKMLRELRGGVYAPMVQREEAVRFLTQTYIGTDAEDSSKTSDLLSRIQKAVEP